MEVEKTKTQRSPERVQLQNYPDVMSVGQLCEVLNVSGKTAYRILRDGRLHSIKVGRAYKIPKFSLLEYLRGLS